MLLAPSAAGRPVEAERDAGAPPTSHDAFLHGLGRSFCGHLKGRNALRSRSPSGRQ
jgi:hypothetical protein